jgi:hypothetical protein
MATTMSSYPPGIVSYGFVLLIIWTIDNLMIGWKLHVTLTVGLLKNGAHYGQVTLKHRRDNTTAGADLSIGDLLMPLWFWTPRKVSLPVFGADLKFLPVLASIPVSWIPTFRLGMRSYVQLYLLRYGLHKGLRECLDCGRFIFPKSTEDSSLQNASCATTGEPFSLP